MGKARTASLSAQRNPGVPETLCTKAENAASQRLCLAAAHCRGRLRIAAKDALGGPVAQLVRAGRS